MGNIGEMVNWNSASSKVVMPLTLLSLNHISFVCRSVQELSNSMRMSLDLCLLRGHLVSNFKGLGKYCYIFTFCITINFVVSKFLKQVLNVVFDCGFPFT